MNSVEVCLSPALFHAPVNASGTVAAVIDVLRATTAFCAALGSGAAGIIPVADLEAAKRMQSEGYLLAAERDGEKVGFADYGNSPVQFLNTPLRGRKLAYSTTNGTQAIELVKHFGGLITACFSNLGAASKYLAEQQKDVLIVCAGWKDSISLEDTLCAGALVNNLLASGKFSATGDATLQAAMLWHAASADLQALARQGTHYKRLLKLGLTHDLDYCFRIDTSNVVPVWDGSRLKKAAG